MKLKNIVPPALSKITLSLLFVSGVSMASETFGSGEYRFGPDTSENFACEMAEIKAKENAISNFLGETVEFSSQRSCINAHCDFNDQIVLDSKGVIKSVSSLHKTVLVREGYKNCVVKVKADVVEIKSNIKFRVDGKLDYFYGDLVDFSLMSNKPGHVYIFNYFSGEYTHIINAQIFRQNTAIPINQLTAYLPKYLDYSKELMVFVFTEKPIRQIKYKYAANEMKNMILSIPVESRKVVYRYLTIRRKVK